MAGLPRSGNTLISSILNQNPKIKVSPNSTVPEIFYRVDSIKSTNMFLNFPNESSLDNITSNIFDLYYKDWDCDYIIDRSFWGTPGNLPYLKKYLKNDIKILCPVRDVITVLSSMYLQRDRELDEILYKQMQNGWFLPIDKTVEEVKCEILMETESFISRGLISVYNLCKPENRKYVKFIEYDNLVENTEEEIKSIYDFLEIDHFEHNFNDIQQYEVNGIRYNDNIPGCPPGLHQIKSSIVKSKTKNIFSEKITCRYSNLEFWRQ